MYKSSNAHDITEKFLSRLNAAVNYGGEIVVDVCVDTGPEVMRRSFNEVCNNSRRWGEGNIMCCRGIWER